MADSMKPAAEAGTLGDDRLGLTFACCHPALAPETRVAMTLRYVAGLTTKEIAAGFLVPEATLAQRLVRAKRKIREAGIRFEVPASHRLGDRVQARQAWERAASCTGNSAIADEIRRRHLSI